MAAAVVRFEADCLAVVSDSKLLVDTCDRGFTQNTPAYTFAQIYKTARVFDLLAAGRTEAPPSKALHCNHLDKMPGGGPIPFNDEISVLWDEINK